MGVQINLKGTRDNIYFDIGSYRIIKKLAIKENKSVEDIVYEAYKDTFMYVGIQIREAMEDFANAIKSEFVPITNKAVKEFIKLRRHINWLNFKRKITNWFKRVFNCKKHKWNIKRKSKIGGYWRIEVKQLVKEAKRRLKENKKWEK